MNQKIVELAAGAPKKKKKKKKITLQPSIHCQIGKFQYFVLILQNEIHQEAIQNHQVLRSMRTS